MSGSSRFLTAKTRRTQRGGSCFARGTKERCVASSPLKKRGLFRLGAMSTLAWTCPDSSRPEKHAQPTLRSGGHGTSDSFNGLLAYASIRWTFFASFASSRWKTPSGRVPPRRLSSLCLRRSPWQKRPASAFEPHCPSAGSRISRPGLWSPGLLLHRVSLYAETPYIVVGATAFRGTIAKTGKIEKKLPFSTIPNRNLLSDTKQRIRKLRGGETATSRPSCLFRNVAAPPSILLFSLLGWREPRKTEFPRPSSMSSRVTRPPMKGRWIRQVTPGGVGFRW